MRVADSWYVLDAKWWQLWKDYVDYDQLGSSGPCPPLIENTEIVEKDGLTLKKELRENYDYVVVHREVWEKLYAWYGSANSISRPVVKRGAGSQAVLSVDLYPLSVRYYLYQHNRTVEMPFASNKPILISRLTSVRDLVHRVAEKINIAPHRLRAWKTLAGDEKKC